MVIDPVCGRELNPKDALCIEYQGKSYYFHSRDCRDQFFLLKYAEGKIIEEKKIPPVDDDTLNVGEYPDPNDLKTHGDINGWTDKKYFQDEI